MAKYGVRSPGNEECFLTMEATDPDGQPSGFVAKDGFEYAATYAEELVKTRGASARGVASRLGTYNEFVEIDGEGVAKSAPRFKSNAERVKYMVATARAEKVEKAECKDKSCKKKHDANGCHMKVMKGEEVDVDLRTEGDIVKTDDDERIVFGWAYVAITKSGEVNEDKSGDFIDQIEELEKSAYDYVLRSRQSDADHTNVKGGEMVESIVFTPVKIEKMGIPAGTVPLGWWVGYKIEDDATWDRVKKGELTSFSIHGKGQRKSVD